MLFRLTLIIFFLMTTGYLFYYVSYCEKVMDINEKRRENRIKLREYQNRIEFENYLKKRYNFLRSR